LRVSSISVTVIVVTTFRRHPQHYIKATAVPSGIELLRPIVWRTANFAVIPMIRAQTGGLSLGRSLVLPP